MNDCFQNQARSAQSEVSQLRDDMRDLTTKLHTIRNEKMQLEQTLLLKICNSQVCILHNLDNYFFNFKSI